jgi:hypothetical protein
LLASFALIPSLVYAGMLAGAVKSPVGLMVPTVEFPPTTSATSQITAVLPVVPETDAVYCTVAPGPAVTYPEGETVTVWACSVAPAIKAKANSGALKIIFCILKKSPVGLAF